MEKIDTLRAYGLFDAVVPRYTSYPPANHFIEPLGEQNQKHWLGMVPSGSVVSVYVHIPYCKRLCWFCACRTQGTKSLRPVDEYIEFLCHEIGAVKAQLAPGVKMARLHLGGGTPTILSARTMTLLLDEIFKAFPTTPRFEFSVEIDPTETSQDLLATLVDKGLNRASVGVQDFALVVQSAIGRSQTLKQTSDMIACLRNKGVSALNLDLLYGLPLQSAESFAQTLDYVFALKPDRLAICGYAHVPWISKRQVMIKAGDIPDSETRYDLALVARKRLQDEGFRPVGIDHFARAHDGLAIAQECGQVHRDFQGYTDDQSKILIGFGASAISKFRQGYLQNAMATSVYQERIAQTGLAADKGYRMNGTDKFMSRIVEDLLCRFELNTMKLEIEFPKYQDGVQAIRALLTRKFPDVFFINQRGLKMHDWAQPLVRIIAKVVDDFTATHPTHPTAI